MTSTHHREFSELPITIDRTADASLPSQIAAALRDSIDREILRPGEAVPATREFASRLGVARGVVVAAYEQLIAEGYLSAGHGRGTRVHPALRSVERGDTSELISGLGAPGKSITSQAGGQPAEPAPGQRHAGPLTPGLPDTSAVLSSAWRAAWRDASTLTHLEEPPLGSPRLRAAISEHLRRMRGTRRSADHIIVTAGAREGLSLLLTTLGSTHGRALTVGVEDPGYPSLRRVAARHGARIVALPVDADGLIADSLPDGLLDAIIVTPSHQYPLGGSLPLARRRALLEWAERTGAVIIEDDYDSELRHSGSPLPALAALDDAQHGSVVLLGTFSKTVSQALSAGFLLAPARLLHLIEPVRTDLGGPVSAVVQAALTDYLESGALRRHTARMRRRYAARRELVVERLYGVAGASVRPMSGGLHAVIELSGGEAVESEVHAACADLGVVPLSAYWQGRDHSTARFGLVIGTGGSVDRPTFETALTTLRAALIRAVRAAPDRAKPPAKRPHD